MLISNSNNFVFIRVPKAGSTSGLFYFLNSGLYDEAKDTVAVEAPFNSWVEMEGHFNRHSEKYLENCMPLLKDFHQQNKIPVHSFYSDLVKTGKIKNNLACYSTIRNPIDRLCSIYFYEQKRNNVVGTKTENIDLNEFCYLACVKNEKVDPPHAKFLQSVYFPEHAKLWNIENLHEHAVADIGALGGKVDNKIHVRKTHPNPKDYKASLSYEIIQMIELKYVHDFALWEKAYAVYN